MATIYIDQKPYEVDPSKNLLEVALAHGLELPYFCWHPALGSVGSCRQCAVQQFQDENDTQGRMVMACMTPLKDGLRFSIEHPNSKDFRKNVIEWMMVNHPHDCPVCDEGGECHLQDMTVMTGHNSREYRFNKRTFRNQNLGPFINHEMNRCITCYRCVRYYRDIAGGTDLSPFANSGRVYFGRHEEGPLESGFSGNLVEVCPTGVFTDKPFHQHHIRKWDLETAPSICQLCSVGCNISPGARYGQLRRVQNRFNLDVNGYFICDRGRFGHDYVNSPQRLKTALIAGQPASLEDAYKKIQQLSEGKAVIGIGSAHASLESNWALKTLVGAENFFEVEEPAKSVLIAETISALSKLSEQSASLSDIRSSDTIVIFGEDITETAPMMALSCRQAGVNFSQLKALKEQNIAVWNDSAVRDYSRGPQLPLFSAAPEKTALDDCAHVSLVASFDEIHLLIQGLIAHFKDSPIALSPSLADWVAKTATALKAANNPVLITGMAHGSQALQASFFKLVELIQKSKFSVAAPQVNSIGLGLLRPKSLAQLKTTVDVAVVLGNGQAGFPVQEALKSVKNIVVVDSLQNQLTAQATVTLPALAFTECTGSVVNQEGRLQRYFSVFSPAWEGIESPWRMLARLCSPDWDTIDDVCHDMAHHLRWPGKIFDELSQATTLIMGHKIARQTSEFSGRTAMNAHVSMHEPPPAQDKDAPFAYSMEGARKKIPLPLIPSSWEPKWNSVQSSFQRTLNAQLNPEQFHSGVKIFSHLDRPIAQGGV